MREWREGLRQSRHVAAIAREESEMRRYHSTREGSSSGASVIRPLGLVKRGGSMRGIGPTGVMDTFMHRKPSSKQLNIKYALKGVKATAASAKHAVKNIVKWFLHAGVPTHTTSSPYFQTMIDSIGEVGPGLKAPTPKDIYGKHLKEELAETKEWVASFKAIWMARGCTLICDGWTETTRRSMINFLVYCSEGTVFIKSVDASGQIKNAEYLLRLMDEMVEEISEENVVQVATDNEASYKAAGRKLMGK
ncbi:hypothetical protein Taro_050725 [Colocasia esculenta]|uniref:DUF659 domain-containing protein n=1 Tax=Colocasia esculenta TaxID=4460 RepID=A0A843XE53_COLES|nr:hypothetical protein [Colocasia esculenta]